MIDKIKFYMNLGINNFEIDGFSFYIYKKSWNSLNAEKIDLSVPIDVINYLDTLKEDYHVYVERKYVKI